MTAEQIEMPHVEGMTHRKVDVGGVGIHIAEAGSGPPVLLLHGWPQHWFAWRKVAPQLAVDHRVICPDLRGFGWSDAPPGAYDKATLAQDIIGLLDALALDRVDLIAHDWGAWIGFLLCLEHPERFDHYLALNMYPPWPDPPSPRAIGVAARLWYQVALATPGLGRALIRHTPFVRKLITTGAVHPDAWTRDELDAFTTALKSRARVNASVRLYRTFLLRELWPYVRGRFNGRRLTVPTLLLHGMRDAAIDHKALGQWESNADRWRSSCATIPDTSSPRSCPTSSSAVPARCSAARQPPARADPQHPAISLTVAGRAGRGRPRRRATAPRLCFH